MKYIAIAIALFGTTLAYTAASNARDQPVSCGGDPAELESAAESRVVRLRISAMLTPNCPKLVEAAARRIDGVTRVVASLETRTATVEYLEGKTTAEEIRAIIADRTGFDAEIVK